MNDLSQPCLSEIFNQQSQANALKSSQRKGAKSTLLVSIRVTAEEKGRLQEMAGSLAISSYIRQKLFDDATVAARPKRYQQKPRQPRIDHVEIAKLLGTFGQSELARSMLALSLAVQIGELEASAEVENTIKQACAEIHDIRNTLIMALGIKPQEYRG
jgi:hypothetical protein